METVRFAAYLDVRGVELTTEQVQEAIELGLMQLLQGNEKFEIDLGVYLVPPIERMPLFEGWQPGHMNSQTSVNQRKNG